MDDQEVEDVLAALERASRRRVKAERREKELVLEALRLGVPKLWLTDVTGRGRMTIHRWAKEDQSSSS